MENDAIQSRRRLSDIFDLDTIGQVAWLFFVVTIFVLAITSLPRH